MNISDNILQRGEKINFTLRAIFSEYGYRPYRMSKFEEYDLYARNKDFLVSDNVITFTDTGGKLMALKPDVTLSIIKNSKDLPDITQKVYYSENVYRVSKSTGSFKEIMQTGLECFGKVGQDELSEVVLLAAKGLKAIGPEAVLDISNLSILEEIISALSFPAEREADLYAALGGKNLNAVTSICNKSDDLDLLLKLLKIHGPVAEVKDELKGLLAGLDSDGFLDFLDALSESEDADIINVDFSVVDDINYYNGIVFKGFLNGIPGAVLSGGQYDRLMRKMGRKSQAAGFAFYTDMLEQADTDAPAANDGWLNIALPKGRLGENVYEMFALAGYECPDILEPGRKLIFENADRKVRYFWVKPSDVAVYVERGAADIGVVGKDILLESEPDVYELLDMNTGKCRMCVAAPKGFKDDPERTLKVATKFSNIAKKYYQSVGRDIDIVHLNGSIEIAPILKLTDVIADIVETGNTLKENDLEVIETIVPDISARFIANKTAFKFKSESIEGLTRSLSDMMENA